MTTPLEFHRAQLAAIVAVVRSLPPDVRVDVAAAILDAVRDDARVGRAPWPIGPQIASLHAVVRELWRGHSGRANPHQPS